MTERNKILVDKFCWQGIREESPLSNVVSLSRQKATGESFVLQKMKKKCLDFFQIKKPHFFQAALPLIQYSLNSTGRAVFDGFLLQ